MDQRKYSLFPKSNGDQEKPKLYKIKCCVKQYTV